MFGHADIFSLWLSLLCKMLQAIVPILELCLMNDNYNVKNYTDCVSYIYVQYFFAFIRRNQAKEKERNTCIISCSVIRLQQSMLAFQATTINGPIRN